MHCFKHDSLQVSNTFSTPKALYCYSADTDITSGQELLHTYGDLSDGELLNTFGFIDTMGSDFKNPNNKVCL